MTVKTHTKCQVLYYAKGHFNNTECILIADVYEGGGALKRHCAAGAAVRWNRKMNSTE